MRKSSTMKTICRLQAAIVVMLGLVLSASTALALTVSVSPQEIPINLSYHGANLVVTGTSAAGDELIVKIASAPHDTLLKYKGKAAGLFWMKMGNMDFKNTPTVYLLSSTSKLGGLLSPAERVQYTIGYPALKERTEIESSMAEPDKDQWFDHFIQFKKKERLYRIQEGTVTRQGGNYRLETAWPYEAAPGTYTVQVLAVRDGKVVESAETSLEVARAGAVATLSRLAFDRAAVYGIMALVVAMAAGFAVGSLFKGGGAH
jgi:uncharacterized protein (TIGR02186 family)